MLGIELAKSYYEEFGKKMLEEKFPDYIDKMAIGLCGKGSECFFCDDEYSKDHDFEPGFCIFVTEEFDEKLIFNLQREYDKLPKEFKGYKKSTLSPVGGKRHGVIKIRDFLYEMTGTYDGNIDLKNFLYIPEQNLLEFTNGEIWRDDNKFFSILRMRLMVFPKDIKLKKMAGELLIMSQSGQYNLSRIIMRKDVFTARLCIYEFINSTIHFLFLINDTYMPYYKWKFKILNLLLLNNNKLILLLEELIKLNDDKILNGEAEKIVDEICSNIINLLKNDFDIPTNNYLEKIAYIINDKIVDNNIRNLHILAGV